MVLGKSDGRGGDMNFQRSSVTQVCRLDISQFSFLNPTFKPGEAMSQHRDLGLGKIDQ